MIMYLELLEKYSTSVGTTPTDNYGTKMSS